MKTVKYNDRDYNIQDKEPNQIGDLAILEDGHITHVENEKQLYILKRDKAKLLLPSKYDNRDIEEIKDNLKKARSKLFEVLGPKDSLVYRADINGIIIQLTLTQDYNQRKNGDNSVTILQ